MVAIYNILLKLGLLLLLTGIVQSGGNVPPPLRAINVAGIRRPLQMRSDRIYLSRSPFQAQRRIHYYPAQRQQQQHGFLRNQPPGANGRRKNQQRNQQNKQWHPNRQFQPVMKPTKIYHPLNAANDYQRNKNQQQKPMERPVELTTQTTSSTSTTTETVLPYKEIAVRASQQAIGSVHNVPLIDPHNLLSLSNEQDGYLMYLYLPPGDNQLDQQFLTAAATAGDKINKITPLQDDEDEQDVIIGSPSMAFDPYISNEHSFAVEELPYQEPTDDFQVEEEDQKDQETNDKSGEQANIIETLHNDWVPIPSPWDKYREVDCNQNKC